MKAYQDGLANFEQAGAKVFGVSTDNAPSLKYWAEEVLKVEQPLLSDFMRKTARDYGVLMEDRGIANRTTFVIDADGKIQHIEEGSAALDPAGAAAACSRLKKK
jgi:peroxiredoxin